MFTPASIAPSLRPWMTVQDGELLLEPVRGISFDLGTSREDLNDHLTALAAYGVCELELQQDDNATYFTIATSDQTSVVVFDDSADRIIAVVPMEGGIQRQWN